MVKLLRRDIRADVHQVAGRVRGLGQRAARRDGKLSDVETTQFQLKKKWMGGRSIWTREQPFDIGPELPAGGGADLVRRQRGAQGQPDRAASEDQVGDRRGACGAEEAAEGVPDAVGKAIVDFNAGNYAKSLATLKAIVDKPPAKDPDGVVPAAQKAIDALKARLDARSCARRRNSTAVSTPPPPRSSPISAKASRATTSC